MKASRQRAPQHAHPAQPRIPAQVPALSLDSRRSQSQRCVRARFALRRGRERGGSGAACERGHRGQRLFTLPLTAEAQRVRARVAGPMVNAVRDPGVRLRGGNAARGGLLGAAPTGYLNSSDAALHRTPPKAGTSARLTSQRIAAGRRECGRGRRVVRPPVLGREQLTSPELPP